MTPTDGQATPPPWRKVWVDYYAILGLPLNVKTPVSDITKRYRELLKETTAAREHWIGGTQPTEDQVRAMDIAAAGKTLRDPELRTMYDREWKRHQLLERAGPWADWM